MVPETHPSPVIYLPQLTLTGDVESSLPLEHTTVSGQVTGPVAAVVIAQRFGNPLKEAAELDYLFPLPEDAAITGFELRVGGRIIQGDLQERERARKSYEEGRDQGRRTGLMEQRRPNLFSLRLANVLPGEVIETTVRYQQRLKFEDDSYEFVFPMGLTPKYESPEFPGDGEAVNAPVIRGDEPAGPVEINLSVDAGLPVGEVSSPSHPIETVRLDDRRFQVRLAGEQIPDRDFVLRYPVAGEQAAPAAWTSVKDGHEIFLATLVPPRLEDEPQIAPREFVFVLDRSGSMTGEPIAQARNALRACLRTLNEADTFRILLFDNDLEWFQPEAFPVTQEHLDRADAFLKEVKGRGGTEIVRALEAVLGLPASSGRTRYVVFLTDGAVSAEAHLLERIRGRLGAARLFTFGVGPSVNRALLSRMASLGRGRAAFLQLDEDIEGAIIRFQDSVSFPVLTNLSLECENCKVWDVYPARLPDLYYGQPLEISGRLQRAGGGAGKMMLRGMMGSQPVELSLVLPEPGSQDMAVERVWARARVDDLLEQHELNPAQAAKFRSELIALALEYNLVTLYTSFVALDREPAVSGGQPRVIHVAQPLPQGLYPGAFFPGSPQQPLSFMAAAMPLPIQAKRAFRAAPEMGQAYPARQNDDTGTGQIADRQRIQSNEPDAAGGTVEATLRWLARTQKLDGSWNGDIEWTAAAVLAFVRAGHTTRAGMYRQALRRAVRWLAEHTAEGTAGFSRALALMELARATGSEGDQEAARSAFDRLPAPADDFERAASGLAAPAPPAIRSLDDLRLAAALRVGIPLPAELYRAEKPDLVRTWAATLPQPASTAYSARRI